MQATTQGAILLLGPPGAGKSILGRALQSTFSSQCDFLSVADELRDEGLLQGSVNAGPVKKIDRQARAKDLLHEACHAAKTSGRCGSHCQTVWVQLHVKSLHAMQRSC
jgi:hypothetical protein